MNLPEIISAELVNNFFSTLSTKLNRECIGKTIENPINSSWTLRNFIVRGRKFDIINEGCSDKYGNYCNICYNNIRQSRIEFEELYNNQLDHQMRILICRVAILDDLVAKYSTNLN